MSLHEEKKEPLAQIKSMRAWASHAEEITNVEVARRFDAYTRRVSRALSRRQNEQQTKNPV